MLRSQPAAGIGGMGTPPRLSTQPLGSPQFRRRGDPEAGDRAHLLNVEIVAGAASYVVARASLVVTAPAWHDNNMAWRISGKGREAF
jgi:hypothetical protein